MDLLAVQERYTAALDRLVDRLQQDYYVLAAVLYGSLARGDAWERSDIDLMIVIQDGHERENKEIWLVEDDINVAAWVVARSRFKRSLEGALQGSIGHHVRSQSKLLFSKDPSIDAWLGESARIAARDQAYVLLGAVSHVTYPLEKAHKWLTARRDPDYCFLWTLNTVNALARVEAILNGEAPGREALDQALRFNPAFFNRVYPGLIHSLKTEAVLAEALALIDGYLLERADWLFRPLLAYLAAAQGPVTAAELTAHFRKKVPGEYLGGVYEWLAHQGLVHKLASPVRLTRKSTVTLDEPAYYYETDDLAAWE